MEYQVFTKMDWCYAAGAEPFVDGDPLIGEGIFKDKHQGLEGGFLIVAHKDGFQIHCVDGEFWLLDHEQNSGEAGRLMDMWPYEWDQKLLAELKFKRIF